MKPKNKRTIDWNREHQTANEQEMSFRLDFITWSAERRWNYLMKLCGQGKQVPDENRQKRIVW